ncbi:hypothetical protein A3I58_03780 [Candidatus Peregrinibacteria bacterium RIFCSPLOWO2_02_FULL_39_10]|nr:MAG: hypothetical protein A3I58_03780 [Candidatus Peregrinibacteria bacterium RIFCSPLOWO2_02_FULL_39_10]
MKRSEVFFGLIKIPADFIMTVLAFAVAYKLRLITEPIKGLSKPIDYSVLPTINEYIKFSLKAALILVIIFALSKMYNLKTTSRFSEESKKSLLACGIWAMAIITYFFFTRTFPFSRLAMLYSWGLTILLIILGRSIVRIIQNLFLKMGIGARHLIFIGNNTLTNTIYKDLIKDKTFKIMGLIGNKEPQTEIKILGGSSQLNYILEKHHPDEVIQTQSHLQEKENEEILEICELNHINYRFIPDLLDVKRTNIEVSEINGIPIINLKPTPLDGWGKVLKRTTDVFGATIGFIIFSPIFILTAIAIKLDSKGPVFFAKLDDGSPVKRVGEYGKFFKFYKFRSMHPRTDNLRYRLAENNLRKDGPLVKIENDPRITRLGRFIRRYSIDELPQLWNVLIGNMSLVGPRPHLPEEVAKYQKHHKFVLTIRPGLTGLAQVSGRSDLNFEEEVKLDRFYIENWSIWKDIKIIIKTLGVTLKGYKE